MDIYQINLQTWDGLADWYDQTFSDSQVFHDLLQQFIDLLPNHKAVIDIGCGPGHQLQFIQSKLPDIKLTAVDPAPAMLAKVQQRIPNAIIVQSDLLSFKNECSYSGVINLFCLPYIRPEDIEQTIHQLYDICEQGGILLISWITGESLNSVPTINGLGQKMYQYLYQNEILLELLRRRGFEVVHSLSPILERPGKAPEHQFVGLFRKS